MNWYIKIAEIKEFSKRKVNEKSATKYYQYFVEGEDEKKIINTLKSDMEIIKAGKVQVVKLCTRKVISVETHEFKGWNGRCFGI